LAVCSIIRCQVLNARPENVEKESEIVAQAGRLKAVTVATNMAGRGTDILLGGNAKGIARNIAKYLMLFGMKLFDIPTELLGTYEKTVLLDADNEPETDPDVLALPPIEALCDYLELALPVPLQPSTELALKRAVVSCTDMLPPTPSRLDVEDMVSLAADSTPTPDVNVRRLRLALETVTKEFDDVLSEEREAVGARAGCIERRRNIILVLCVRS